MITLLIGFLIFYLYITHDFRYSDDYYRASLINALSNTLVLNEHETRYPEQMSENARRVTIEILHALNMDTMKPSFGKIVTVQCLYAIQKVEFLKLF